MKNVNLNSRYHNVISKHKSEFDDEYDWDSIEIVHSKRNYLQAGSAGVSFHKKGEKKTIQMPLLS